MKISLNQINELLERKVTAKEVEKAFSEHAFEVDDIEEVQDDIIFDVDVLPNRSSDALSQLGLARELSAILNIPLKNDFLLQEKPEFEDNGFVSTSIDHNSSAHIYGAAYIEGVTVKESPEWLKSFLEKLGQKSINNIVDATNYVLFFLGQPTHAFDADKLSGTSIGVRAAKEGERITTLDNEEYELNPEISVIYDANSSDEKALAIAGIKGGLESAVTESTKNIIIESARFDPTKTRKAAKSLKLFTDASKRFENNIPQLLPFYGMRFLIDLILEIAGGELKGVSFTIEGAITENPYIDFDLNKINARLGTEISEDEAKEILSRLHFEFENGKVKAPFWRTDINIIEDLSEEIIRLHGLHKVKPQALPAQSKDKNILDSFYYAEKLRKFLLDKNWIEVTNSSLQDKGELRLKNALASDKNYYRDNLKYQLIKALDKNERNAPLLGIYDSIKIFEIGNVYKDGHEYTSVALAVRPIKKKKREANTMQILNEIKTELETKFNASLPEPDGEVLEFPLDVIKGTLDERKYPSLPVLPAVQYKPFSQYPFVLRDIAVWLPEGEDKERLEKLIQEKSGNLLVRMDLFDEYHKDGRVSYAYHLVFQSYEKTLTDDEVNTIMQEIEDKAREFGWEPR